MQHIGKYKVIRQLGAGGFGAVYLAEDPRLGEQVAIKVFKIRDENLAQQATSATSDAGDVLRQRFLNEARTLRQLQRNPHIVNVFDFDEMEDGTPYYVMPYIPHSLRHELGSDATDVSVISELEVEDKPKRLPIAKALIYLEQLLIALKDVHKAGLIHRDIKPANLLLDEHGDVKLCDFGIAKVPDAEHSCSGVGMGSRNYMAPEQRQSAKHVDCSSDIYSVGVLAYRMITGTLPEGRFADLNTYQPALTDTLNELILKALAQQKEQRFVDASEMLKALKAATQNTSPIEEDSTGTWVEQGSAQIKSELKPLQDRILTLLEQQGEITPKDMPVLQALADIGNLDERDLKQLISHSQQQLAKDNPLFKGLQSWVNAINKQIEQGALNKDKQQALIEAGLASTGKDKEELTALITAKQPKAQNIKPNTSAQNNPKAEAAEKQATSTKPTPTQSPQPKKGKAPLMTAVYVSLICMSNKTLFTLLLLLPITGAYLFVLLIVLIVVLIENTSGLTGNELLLVVMSIVFSGYGLFSLWRALLGLSSKPRRNLSPSIKLGLICGVLSLVVANYFLIHPTTVEPLIGRILLFFVLNSGPFLTLFLINQNERAKNLNSSDSDKNQISSADI